MIPENSDVGRRNLMATESMDIFHDFQIGCAVRSRVAVCQSPAIATDLRRLHTLAPDGAYTSYCSLLMLQFSPCYTADRVAIRNVGANQ
jgi:hypothetical protein